MENDTNLPWDRRRVVILLPSEDLKTAGAAALEQGALLLRGFSMLAKAGADYYSCAS